MERLSDNAIEIINALHTEKLDYNSEYLPLIEAANRLAAYEDSRLEPEIIMEHRFLIAATKNMGALRRLREVAEGDKEGRVALLPCKVGDWVYALWAVPTAAKYVIYCAEVKEIRMSNRNCRLTTTYILEPIEFRGHRKEFREDDFGKTVFLTSEDAERALAADKNVGHTIPVNDLYDEDGGDVRKGGNDNA